MPEEDQPAAHDAILETERWLRLHLVKVLALRATRLLSLDLVVDLRLGCLLHLFDLRLGPLLDRRLEPWE